MNKSNLTFAALIFLFLQSVNANAGQCDSIPDTNTIGSITAMGCAIEGTLLQEMRFQDSEVIAGQPHPLQTYLAGKRITTAEENASPQGTAFAEFYLMSNNPTATLPQSTVITLTPTDYGVMCLYSAPSAHQPIGMYAYSYVAKTKYSDLIGDFKHHFEGLMRFRIVEASSSK